MKNKNKRFNAIVIVDDRPTIVRGYRMDDIVGFVNDVTKAFGKWEWLHIYSDWNKARVISVHTSEMINMEDMENSMYSTISATSSNSSDSGKKEEEKNQQL